MPTDDEWSIARRADPALPVRQVLRAFGGRRQLVANLRSLAESDAAYADIVDLLPESVIEGRSTSADQDATIPPARASVTGQVYLARMGKYYKIGRTRAVGRRMYELKIQLPERLKLVHVLETDDPEGIERYWHERFKDRNTNGEWFSLSREDVGAFKRRGRFM